jgi:hypothetical protein
MVSAMASVEHGLKLSAVEEGAFVEGVASWPQRTTIQHWQLRDLVSCGESDDEFYTVCGKQVLSFDTTVGQAFVVQVSGAVVSSSRLWKL